MISKKLAHSILGTVLVSTVALTGCSASVDEGDDAAQVSSESDLTLTPERKEIIAAVKAGYEPSLQNQKTLLNFQDPDVPGVLTVKGDFAFVIAKVQLPDGSEPSIKGTTYEAAEAQGFFDGFTVQAVLKKTNGKWAGLSVGLGATDTMCGADISELLGAPMPADLTNCVRTERTEKEQILDAARAFLEPALNGQSVLFNFKESEYVNTSYAVKVTFAFVTARVQLADGSEPVIKGTSFEAADKAGVFDGPTFEGAFKKSPSGWKVVIGAYGATDTMCTSDLSEQLGEPMPAGLTACK